MFKSILTSVCILLTLNITAQMDDNSYSAGVIIAQDLVTQGLTELDEASFFAAISDVLQGKELKISMADAKRNFMTYMQEAKMKAHQGNKDKGEQFLATNGQRKEVTTTASGLQYEVLTPAEGAKPTLTNKVKVHYHGTLIDGTVFDSSVDRGEPISFPLNGVITGWQEGLQLMSGGSKYRLLIPYNLAYGERAAGAAIGPYSALIFDVTLLAIE